MPKSNLTRRVRACLVSQHPLVLTELRRVLAGAQFQLQDWRPESLLPRDTASLSIPAAPIYVVDAHVPRPATHALIGAILERYAEARLIVLMEQLNDAHAFSLLRMGVKGLLSYSEALPQLPRALQAVSNGGYWVPRPMLARFVDSILSSLRARRLLTAPANLSRREQEVFGPLIENLSNKEIANKLNVSERTVKFHVSNLLAKFGVRRRADLILLCYQARTASS